MSILVMGTVSCAMFKRGSRSAPPDTVLDVRNNGFADVVMYIVVGGADPYRLGLVPGNSSGSLRVRASMLGTGVLQLLARPIAQRQYSLPAVSVSAGDHVRVTLENSPAQSQVMVEPREP